MSPTSRQSRNPTPTAYARTMPRKMRLRLLTTDVSKRNRIFLGIVLAYAVGVGFLLWRLVGDIDPRYRESAEESLVETAHLLASLVEQQSPDGVLKVES